MSFPERTPRTLAYACGRDPRWDAEWLRSLTTAGAVTSGVADGWNHHTTPWADRPGAGRLWAAARAGDQVLVPTASAVAGDSYGLVAAVRAAATRGVTLCLAPAPGLRVPLTAATLRQMVATAAAVRAARRERHRASTRAGIAAALAAGRRHTRHPGYGYRWAGRPGCRRRVADEYEQAIIERIIRWRAAGHSCRRIAVHLMVHRVRTAAGREWSADRVRRASAAFAHPIAKSACGQNG